MKTEIIKIDQKEFVIDTMYLMIKHIIGQKEADQFLEVNADSVEGYRYLGTLPKKKLPNKSKKKRGC